MPRALSTGAMSVILCLAALLPNTDGFSPSSFLLPPQIKHKLTTINPTRSSSALHASASSMFSIPSLFNSRDSRPIVLFDGKCNLCNAGVQLILDHDRADVDKRGNLRVAALQSRVGRVLVERLPKWQRGQVRDSDDNNNNKNKSLEYKSIVVMGPTPKQTHINSSACIYIGKQLRGPLRYLALLASLLPSFIRDFMYKKMSRYRKRFFGESPECRLWDDNWDTRFVNDGVFGGLTEDEGDLFADPSKKDNVEVNDNIDYNAPVPNVGTEVRVISSTPIVHSHVRQYPEGLCSVGLVGRVVRVLNPRAYPKNVVVQFDLEQDNDDGSGEKCLFEAHFYPWQLQKE